MTSEWGFCRMADAAVKPMDCQQAFRMPKKNWWVLLSPDGTWGYERQGCFVPFDTLSSCMPLLPLLEISCSEVLELVGTGLEQAGIDGSLFHSFPLESVISLALQWKTDYWTQLALEWLEGGYPLSSDYVTSLERLSTTQRRSQRVRHRAARLARQYRRNRQ